jgi:hypothetical protein
MANSGPIPGENYTSDTKNYPWHRPPEFTDIDKALDMLAKKITNFKTANNILSSIEVGIPLYQITSMIIMAGIGEGKWTVDVGLLLAGPLTKMLETMAIAFDVEYDLGLDEDEDFNTGTFFKEEKAIKEYATGNAYKIIKEEMPEIKEAAGSQEAQGGEDPEPTASTPKLESQGFMSMMSGG